MQGNARVVVLTVTIARFYNFHEETCVQTMFSILLAYFNVLICTVSFRVRNRCSYMLWEMCTSNGNACVLHSIRICVKECKLYLK